MNRNRTVSFKIFTMLLNALVIVAASNAHAQRPSIWDCGDNETNPLPIYDSSGPLYRIPVVVHIIRDGMLGDLTNETVFDQIATLNADFAGLASSASFPARIEFFIAPVGTTNAFAIIRYDNASWFNDHSEFPQFLVNLNWDPSRYLNIYTQSLPSAGKSSTPWTALAYDGIRIDWQYFAGGRHTLTHEAGHYLGLVHTYENGCGDVTNCNITGDFICDTPPTAAITNCVGGLSCDSFPAPVENFMRGGADSDACRSVFTIEQVRRMRCILMHRRAFLPQNLPQSPLAGGRFVMTSFNTGGGIQTQCAIPGQIPMPQFLTVAGNGLGGFDSGYRQMQFMCAGGLGQVTMKCRSHGKASRYSFSGVFQHEFMGTSGCQRQNQCTSGFFMSSVSYSATFSVDAPARAQLTLHDPNAIFVIYPVPAQSGNTYHLAAGVEYGVNVTYYAGVRSWSDGSTIASNFGPTEIFRFALLPPHPGDANGDGSVNVNDLLAVIAGWGSCPAPPAACPGDVAPSPNGDGVINVLDLLAAISNWG